MPVPIAIAIVEHEGRFLVGQRPEGVPLAGFWEFPGGKIRPEETPEQAAAHECLEETGLAIAVDNACALVTHEYEHGWVTLYFYRCSVRPPVADVRPPFVWVTLAELSKLEFPAANTTVIKRLMRDQEGNKAPPLE